MSELIDIALAMREKCRRRPVDWVIAALADVQHGVVTRSQLLALGLSSAAIGRRVEAGRLHVLHPGVYAVGDRALPPLGRLAAAVYASGTDAVAGIRSAAALHGLCTHSGWPEVTARPGTRTHDGIEIRRAILQPDEITRV